MAEKRSDDGALTFEKLQKCIDDAIARQGDYHTEAPLILVSPEAAAAMDKMPGGRTLDNYIEYLMNGRHR